MLIETVPVFIEVTLHSNLVLPFNVILSDIYLALQYVKKSGKQD